MKTFLPLPAGKGHVAFASIVLMLGAVLVIRGVNLQGFVWWALFSVLAGVLMNGKESLAVAQRVLCAAGVSAVFSVTCVGLYLIFGVLPSGHLSELHSAGIDLDKVIQRVLGFSWSLATLFVSIWLCTILVVSLASAAAVPIEQYAADFLEVRPSMLKGFQIRFKIVISIAVAIGVAVAYFAGG